MDNAVHVQIQVVCGGAKEDGRVGIRRVGQEEEMFGTADARMSDPHQREWLATAGSAIHKARGRCTSTQWVRIPKTGI